MSLYSDIITGNSSLLAYYRLGDTNGSSTVADLGPFGLTGTVSGTGITLGSTAQITGDANTSAAFGGSGTGAITLPNSSHLAFSNGSDFSIVALVNFSVGDSSFHGIISNYDGTNGLGIGEFGGSTFTLQAEVFVGGSESDARGTQSNGLHQITLVYTAATGNLSLFCDSAFQGNTSGLGNFQSTAAWVIGKRNSTSFYAPACKVQEVAFFSTTLTNNYIDLYSRAALTPANVAIRTGPTEPVNIIALGDFAIDVDDCADLTCLCGYASHGQANILAVITDSANVYSAPTAKAILVANGKSSVPVGAWMGSNPSGVPSGSVYTQDISTRFRSSETRSSYTDSTTILRTALHAAADASVVMVENGYATALTDLLASSADGIDSRDGNDLIVAKVIRLVIGSGIWSSNSFYSQSPEFNLASDASNYHTIVTTWPTEKVWAGIELTGFGNPFDLVSTPPSGADPLVSPLQYAFNLFAPTDNSPPNGKRAAYGQVATVAAVRGESSLGTNLFASVRGTAAIDASTGASSFTPNASSGSDYFLRKIASNASFEIIFNKFISGINTAPILFLADNCMSGGFDSMGY